MGYVTPEKQAQLNQFRRPTHTDEIKMCQAEYLLHFDPDSTYAHGLTPSSGGRVRALPHKPDVPVDTAPVTFDPELPEAMPTRPSQPDVLPGHGVTDSIELEQSAQPPQPSAGERDRHRLIPPGAIRGYNARFNQTPSTRRFNNNVYQLLQDFENATDAVRPRLNRLGNFVDRSGSLPLRAFGYSELGAQVDPMNRSSAPPLQHPRRSERAALLAGDVVDSATVDPRWTDNVGLRARRASNRVARAVRSSLRNVTNAHHHLASNYTRHVHRTAEAVADPVRTGARRFAGARAAATGLAIGSGALALGDQVAERVLPEDTNPVTRSGFVGAIGGSVGDAAMGAVGHTLARNFTQHALTDVAKSFGRGGVAGAASLAVGTALDEPMRDLVDEITPAETPEWAKSQVAEQATGFVSTGVAVGTMAAMGVSVAFLPAAALTAGTILAFDVGTRVYGLLNQPEVHSGEYYEQRRQRFQAAADAQLAADVRAQRLARGEQVDPVTDPNALAEITRQREQAAQARELAKIQRQQAWQNRTPQEIDQAARRRAFEARHRRDDSGLFIDPELRALEQSGQCIPDFYGHCQDF